MLEVPSESGYAVECEVFPTTHKEGQAIATRCLNTAYCLLWFIKSQPHEAGKLAQVVRRQKQVSTNGTIQSYHF